MLPVLVLAVAVLALPGIASAAGPSLVSPADGASFDAQSPPTFVAVDQPRIGSGASADVWISVSSSSAVGDSGQIGKGVEFAEMIPSAPNSTTYTWSDPNAGLVLWAPGTYYWQVSHIDCAATPSCEVVSSVRSFVIKPVPPLPPPQPVTPADGATVQVGATVYFTVYAPQADPISTRILFPDSSGLKEIAAYGYGVDNHTALFRVTLGDQPGSLTWTPAWADCEGPPSCYVKGPTRTLNVVASAPPSGSPAPKPRPPSCKKGFTRAKIAGGSVCLRAGEFCARSHSGQYRRHGYACVLVRGRYRLVRSCPSGSKLAVIGGRRACLRPGKPCAPAHAQQYRRHGYSCVLRKGKYRLVRRPLRGAP